MKRTLLMIALATATCTAGVAVPVSAAGPSPAASGTVTSRVNDFSTVRASPWINTQYGDRRGERRGGRRGGPDAVLFSNPDLRGQRFVIDGEYMPDLANTGFNDRAQSLHVERGYWIFCSDAQFQGRCRTFGPGDYPRLGWSLDNKVSSGRRISNDYPYRGQPNWGDRR
jgi:hypothetical protein